MKTMLTSKGLVHIECGIFKNVTTSTMEEELGGFSINFQRIESIQNLSNNPPIPIQIH